LGELVALDISAPRLRRVQENLHRLNLQATLLAGDASEPDAWWDGRAFNRILLDVPCSATGVIRRHPDIKLLRRPADIDALARRQAHLLTQIWPLLAPGGRLLYASCSALRQENAAVVAAFLKAHADARDCTAAELSIRLPEAGALLPYVGPGQAIAAGETQMDGFYYACLDKRD
jgi:16S rRNA (cytosine967-C5)-methyltransferase